MTIDECPACGSHVLYEVQLDYAGDLGFRPDVHGVTPELGDTIASCGDCGAFAITDSSSEPAAQAPALQVVTTPAPSTEGGPESGSPEGT